MKRRRSDNIRSILSDSVLCLEFYDSIDREYTSLSRKIWVDNASVTRERKRGIWFGISGEEKERRFAFIDTKGNFHTRAEQTELREDERDEIRSFVRLFGKEIEMLSKQTLFLDEFISILLECRCLASSFTGWKYFDINILGKVRRRWREGILREEESLTGVKVRLDTLSTYNLLNRSDNIHYVEFRKNRTDSILMYIDKELSILGRDERFSEAQIKKMRNFTLNNRSLIAALSDYPYTGIDTDYFRSSFIPGGERMEKEERKLEEKVTGQISKYRKMRGLSQEYDIYEAKPHLRPLS